MHTVDDNSRVQSGIGHQVSATGSKPSDTQHPKPDTQPRDTGLTDRRLGGLLLVFFLALYLLTGGGHGYSPDGEFAYYTARSLTLDPEHEYIKKMRRGLDQWGVAVPLLSQPLVLLGETLSRVMPEKDYATVDGRTFVLGLYLNRGSSGDSPTVGPRATGVPDSYVRSDIEGGPSTTLALISFLALANDVPQGATVAEITLIGAAGDSVVLPLRAGVETAEWKLVKTGDGAKHGMARVASVWAGNTSGRNYYAEIPLGRVLEPRELRVRYLADQGHFYVRSLVLLNQDTGAFEPIEGENRFWSERENDDLFARFFYTPFNGIVTAIGCVLLFALARLFGYGQVVSLVATLLYGVATVAWPYSKYDFSEPTLVMFVLLTLYLILRWGQGGRKEGRSLGTPQTPPGAAPWTRLLTRSSGTPQTPPGGLRPPGPPPLSTQDSALRTQHPSNWWLLAAGVSALACMATKYASGVLIPLMLLQIVLLHWEKRPSLGDLPKLIKPLLLFCAPFALVAAPALWYLSRSFGYYPSILEAWAGVQRGWLPLPLSIGLRGILFSPGKSFFLYSPPTLLALVSAIPFVRRHGVRAIGILAITLVYFTIYSKKAAWHAGAGWGPRYQVLVIPLVILIAVPLIQRAIEQRHRWARYALLATFVLGVGLQLLAVSKSFDYYLGVFRSQVVKQLPDEGARWGGADYYPYSAGLDDGNSITATLWAWPFSPILAHSWLLAGDVLALGPAFVQPYKEKLLSSPPWKLWGIQAVPAHPEYGLGLDFWSMRMRTDFPSYPGFLAGVAAAVLLLEILLVISGARLTSLIFGRSTHRSRAVKAWVLSSILALLAFNGIHFIL